MPKGKKKKEYPGRHDEADVGSDAGDDLETCSVLSNVSSGSTYVDAVNEDLDDEGTRQLLLQTINTAVDSLSEKRAETRIKALTDLTKIFRSQFLDLESEWTYTDTLLDSIDRCLRKGGAVEQALAAQLFAIFCVQNDPQLLTSWVPKFVPYLQVLLRDPNCPPSTRSAAITAVAVSTFLSLDDNYKALAETINLFETVFRGSYLKGDKSVPNIVPEVANMHVAALEAWALLFTTVPNSQITEITKNVINRLPNFLESHHVDVRIVGGEVLALIYERIRSDVDSGFRGHHFMELKEILLALANDGAKHRAKVDRRKQRQSFREVLATIESREPIYERIRFGKEELELDNWLNRRCYDSMCKLLGSGMNVHLKDNFWVRDIFDLGAPLPKLNGSEVRSRDNKNQRRLANQASEKMRSQARKPNRNKRFACVPSDD